MTGNNSNKGTLEQQKELCKKFIKDVLSHHISNKMSSDHVETNLSSDQQARNQKMYERRMSINVPYWRRKHSLFEGTLREDEGQRRHSIAQQPIHHAVKSSV